MMRRFGTLLAFAAFTAAGCGEDSTGAPPAPVIVAVQVAPATPTIDVGATVQLTATALDDASAPVATTFTWASATSAVATVSATGLVTGIAAGTAVITATSATGIAGTASVTVEDPVASVQVSPSTATFALGGTQQLTATPRNAAGSALAGREVTWASSSDAIATVSASGLVTAVAAGTATITATSEGVSGTATITVVTVTGAWSGTIFVFGGTCGFTMSITQTGSSFSGTGALSGPDCIDIGLAINAGTVAGSAVTFNFTAPSEPALPAVNFSGTWNLANAITGSWSGGFVSDAPSTLTRASPGAPPAAAAAVRVDGTGSRTSYRAGGDD